MIIRPFTFITGLLFLLSGAYLFAVKHRSQMLESQMEQAASSTRQDEASIRVLQAQWALEADPSRLAQLATQFTGLQPMKPGQLVTLAALGSALPPPGSAAPGSNPEDTAAPVAQMASAQPAANPVAAAQMAQAAPAAAAPQPGLAQVQAKPQAAKSREMVASVPRPAHAVTKRAPEELASVETLLHNLPPESPRREKSMPRPGTGSSLYVASAALPAPRPAPVSELPMGAQVVSVRAVASAAAPAPMDDGGSMLGMAQGGGTN